MIHAVAPGSSSAQWKSLWSSQNSGESWSWATASRPAALRGPLPTCSSLIPATERRIDLALDDPANVVEAPQVVEVDARRNGRPLRLGDDQPLGLESAHGLPDRDVADPEALLELATLIGSPGLISPASSARRSRSVTLSTMLTRWMVSSRRVFIVPVGPEATCSDRAYNI